MRSQMEILPKVFIQPRVIETARGSIEFDITDDKGPAVLSFHGGIGGVDQARVILGWVDASRYRLLSPSRPGYLGTPLESGKTVEEQADLFAALLDKLQIDKVACVSASAGGPPGYMFAIRHPDRVWAMVAIDSVSGFYDMPEKAGPITQMLFLSQAGQKFLKMIEDARPELFLQQIFQTEAYLTKKQIKEHVEQAMRIPDAPAFLKAFMATMSPYNARKKGTFNDMEQYRKLTHLPLEKVKCPTLVIHGTHDADVKLYDGVYAYEHIPGCERYWIEEGSHMGFWLNRHSPEAQKAARDFLAKHHPA